jgi:hypothetical protein
LVPRHRHARTEAARLVTRPAHLNDTDAREPEHVLDPPVPITARIVWADDGEEHIDTVALGWTGRDLYVRLPGSQRSLASGGVDMFGVRVHRTA